MFFFTMLLDDFQHDLTLVSGRGLSVTGSRGHGCAGHTNVSWRLVGCLADEHRRTLIWPYGCSGKNVQMIYFENTYSSKNWYLLSKSAFSTLKPVN